MIRIVFDSSNIIVEHGLRLGERDSVLAEIAALLVRVPFECRHSNEAPRGGSIVQLAVPVNPGMPVGDMLSKDISLISEAAIRLVRFDPQPENRRRTCEETLDWNPGPGRDDGGVWC